MNDIKFDGQVAIVTGAGGGLGRTYALELARRGARVVVNDLGGSTTGDGGASGPADQTVAAIRDAGGEAVANYDSVATTEGGEAIVQEAIEAFGTVDILINNAGILRDVSFAKLTEADLRAVVDVHLLGAFFVSQPAFRVMKDRGYGRLLFTSSSAGLWGNFGQTSYGAAKMGLVGLSNVLAIEGERYGIRSNVIAPAAASRLNAHILGDLAPGLGTDLVAPLATYLVSRECEITHHVFSVGGGRFARVFLGLGPGWMAERGVVPTAEDVRGHLPEILAEGPYLVPFSLDDEQAVIEKTVRGTPAL
jgi:NAD(P)-dependent dehydrogenase (short-subunit alcohol dehydrogenase family)